MTLKIGIVAGEASGDLLGAGLIQALRSYHPDIQFSGVGGELMLKAGFSSLFDQEELAVMGIVEPLRRLPRLLHIRRKLYQHFSQTKPAVFIGIDSPDFNLGLELKLRQQGLKTVHYVSPTVWAWRQNRIYKIAKAIDLMLTLLPFEAEFYKKHQVPVKFVGHPLADKIAMQVDKETARSALQLVGEAPVLALLPGSRRQELRHLGRAFLETALLCYQKKPNLRFITSSINKERDAEWRALHQAFAPELPLEFFVGRSREVMAAADTILVTSGTATLESMLFKRPMVIAYRTGAFNYFLAKLLVKTPFIGLPNLLAQEALVPELIQEAVQPEKMAELLLNYWDQPEKTLFLQERFSSLHRELSQNADLQAAAAVWALLSRAS
jgi:lipid-A-disaccharide synthase